RSRVYTSRSARQARKTAQGFPMTPRWGYAMKRLADQDRERGSLILALLMTVVLTASGTLLIVATLGQEATTRHDQKFTQVLPAADAGISRGLFMLNNGLSGSLPTTSTAPGGLLSLNGQTAQWWSQTQTWSNAPTSYL